MAPKETRDNIAKTFYSMRPGNFEHAVEDIKQYVNQAIDGSIISPWLLSEIDHWDHEKERICIVTDKQLLIIKYNFVALRIEECRRLNLKEIDKIQDGKFVYPKHSIMITRQSQNGLRLHVDKNHVLSTWEKWSPLYRNPPFFTFTQHKAVPLLDEVPQYMAYEEFKKAVISAIEGTGATFESVCQEIPLDVYVGLMSVVHNSSDLGYSKDRGALSF